MAQHGGVVRADVLRFVLQSNSLSMFPWMSELRASVVTRGPIVADGSIGEAYMRLNEFRTTLRLAAQELCTAPMRGEDFGVVVDAMIEEVPLQCTQPQPSSSPSNVPAPQSSSSAAGNGAAQTAAAAMPGVAPPMQHVPSSGNAVRDRRMRAMAAVQWLRGHARAEEQVEAMQALLQRALIQAAIDTTHAATTAASGIMHIARAINGGDLPEVPRPAWASEIESSLKELGVLAGLPGAAEHAADANAPASTADSLRSVEDL